MDALNFLKIEPLPNWYDYFLDRGGAFRRLITSALPTPHQAAFPPSPPPLGATLPPASFNQKQQQLASLMDQFIEQAMIAEREASMIEKKLAVMQVDAAAPIDASVVAVVVDADGITPIATVGYEEGDEDLVNMRVKTEELWMCAACCAAAVGWRVELMVECSNTIRLRALFTRIMRWIFGNEICSTNSVGNPWAPNLDDSSLANATPLQLFFTFLYAKWVLGVERASRLPSPAAKPTVSNPQALLDANLALAERIAQATAEVRQSTREAVELMKRVEGRLMSEEKGAGEKRVGRKNGDRGAKKEGGGSSTRLDGVEVPSYECFFPSLNLIRKVLRGGNGGRVNEWTTIRPNFSPPHCTTLRKIPSHLVRFAIHHELMLTHFAARHFTTARALLRPLISSCPAREKGLMTEGVVEYASFEVDPTSLRGYARALGLNEETSWRNGASRVGSGGGVGANGKRWKSSRQRRQSGIKQQVELAVESLEEGGHAPRALVAMLGNGSGDERGNLAFTNEFTKMLVGRMNRQPTSPYLITATRFLCAISPAFAASLPPLLLEGLVSATAASSSGPLNADNNFVVPPWDESNFEELTSCGPPLWNVLTSYNIGVLMGAFTEMGTAFKVPPRHHYSLVAGDKLLTVCDERRHDQVAMLLWKLEVLVRTGNMPRWMTFAQEVATHAIGDLVQSNPSLQYLLVFDAIRAQSESWNRQLHRNAYEPPQIFETKTTDLVEKFSSTLRMMKDSQADVFLKTSVQLAAFMLNNAKWVDFYRDISEHKCFKTRLTDVAKVLAAYLHYAEDLGDEGNAYQIANGVCWKVLLPTFEASSKHGNDPQLHITQDELLSLFSFLKRTQVLDLILSLVVHLYNSTVPVPMETDGSGGTRSQSPTTAPQPLATKHIYFPSEISPWEQPGYDGSALNIPFLYSIFDVLLENALHNDPLNVVWLRVLGDYHYARGNYAKAMRHYVELMILNDRSVAGAGGVKPSRINMDDVYSKMAMALAEWDMPTLAAMVGQLREDIRPHLPHVPDLLRGTANSADAGCAYFPFIANSALMEAMADAYAKMEKPFHHRRLLKEYSSRAMNENNPPEVLQREIARRVARFKQTLINHFFDVYR